MKILARLWTQKDGVVSEKILNYHKCTSEDKKEFFPMNERNKAFVKEKLDDVTQGFYCLDWTEDFEIYGSTAMDS